MATPPLRGFLSYSTEEKVRAAEVKSVIAELGVNAFMAHDDISVSQKWRDRILQELQAIQVFVPLLSAAFKASAWASQEIGVVIARPDVFIIPTSLDGTVPYGFIGTFQSRLLPNPATNEFFRDALAGRFPRTVIPRLIERLAAARSFRGAEALMAPLVPYFDQFSPEEAKDFAIASTENGQIWDAGECRVDYIPDFLEKNADKLDPAVREPLEFQIQEGRRFFREARP